MPTISLKYLKLTTGIAGLILALGSANAQTAQTTQSSVAKGSAPFAAPGGGLVDHSTIVSNLANSTKNATAGFGTYGSYSQQNWYNDRCVYTEYYSDGTTQYAFGIFATGNYLAAYSPIGSTTVQMLALTDYCRWTSYYTYFFVTGSGNGSWTWIYQVK
jgi:hypothetical protein